VSRRLLLVLALLCSLSVDGCVRRTGGSTGGVCIAAGRDGRLIECETEPDARVGDRCVCSDIHGLFVGRVE